MSIEVKVPNLPESVSEATVADWHKQQGDSVDRDENLVDLETDKVMLEVPAAAAGVLTEIKVQAGDTVQAGDVLAILEEGGQSSGSGGSKSDSSDDDSSSETEASGGSGKGKSSDNKSASQGQSPAVRKLLTEHDLSADEIEGSGKGGRLTKADVEAHLEESKSGGSGSGKKSAQESSKAESKPESSDDTGTSRGGPREEQRVPMTRIRARIAERLVEAQTSAAMLTTFNEVDLKAVMDARKQYKEAFEKSHGVKLGMMSFFVKATIEALRRYPIVNASIDGNDIIYHGYYDIGIAVSAPRGLVVPILRDADTMDFAGIEQAIVDYGTRAKDNKLTMDDLTGGTFSITNGGVFGSMLSTPILNPPQSAILGMHGIKEKPVVVNGEIVIRPMMYLALTYDHRIIDGRDAVLALRTIKETLEDPARMLLGV